MTARAHRRTRIFSVLAALGFTLALPAFAAIPPAINGEPMPSLAPMLAKVTPAVVNISTKTRVRARDAYLDDPLFRQLFGNQGAPRERVEQSLGSGVVIDADKGYVLTNHHVVGGADDTTVTLQDGRDFKAKLLGSDPETDVAVLQIPAERLQALPIADSSLLRVGDFVVAVGDPFGLGQTATSGMVSALGRSGLGKGFQNFIQTDASINPGNSGGALVDMTGKLVGINTAIFSRSGGSQGIGFAIPANMVRVVVASAKGGGKAVKRPWLGARLQTVTPEIAETLGLKAPNGALVANVTPGSPAARAGLKLSDLIVSIDGQSIEDLNAFDYRFATRPLGGTAQLDIQRNGKPVKLTVPLEVAPDIGRDEIVLTGRSPLQGAKVANISPAVADELNLDASTEGVVVTDLADGGTAAGVGFQKGDIILAVNNQKIEKTADLEKATRESARLWRITVVRGGQQINVTLGG
jgi:Do/DeqQ family serine protease